ncbi:DUF424 domain-containing protein [Halobaculum gomorrense]|uniref:DUF424 domain-containing protein n=1 Tax=Halobaculum gomorrense TaxID=43928 RepID=A0A1M5Q4U1_9EURY|nr:DUF424 family protein [Halobaculum gomorrense]SHH08946.1 hypothetical protein SAMN05443636_1741 [Halobaculum gomorrense]
MPEESGNDEAARTTVPDAGADYLLTRRETPEGTLVAVCDAAVLGETFEDGPVSIEVTESFYGGEDAEPADADAVVEGLYDADTANLVGEGCVGVAVDAGVIDADRVLEVGETLHAQLLWL